MRRPALAFLPAFVLAASMPGQARFAEMEKDTLPHVLGRVLAGDLDGDGDGDLIVLGQGLAGAALFLNAGDLRFAEASHLLPGPLAFGHFADLDGDGDLDVIGLEDQVRRRTVVWVNVGRGVLVDASATANAILALPVDVDRDGDLDLVGGYVQLNDGQNRFARDPRPFPNVAGVLVPADVDADADTDLLALGSQPGRHRLLANDGTGLFTDVTAGRLPDLGYAQGATFADFDGEGDRDFVTAEAATPGWRLALNQGNGTFVAAAGNALPVGSYTRTISAADLDADSDADLLAVIEGIGARVQVLRNDGTGRFAFAPPDWIDSTLAGWPSFADFDGDGLADVAMGEDSSPIHLLVRARAGGFWRANPFRVWSWAVPGPLGDFDGDATTDLVLGLNEGALGWRPLVLPNEGHGYLRSPAGNPCCAAPTAAGDIDGDGDLDVALAQPGNTWETYKNDGRGNLGLFQYGQSCATQQRIALALRDADADGDLDLFVRGGDCLRVMANDGAGRFAFRSAQSIPGIAGGVVEDIDRDGLPEIVNSRGLYTTTGDGRFADASHRVAGVSFPVTALLPAGRDDLVVESQGLAVLLRRAGGQWLPAQLLGSLVTKTRTADLDGDGLREVLLSVGSIGSTTWVVFGLAANGTYVDVTRLRSLDAATLDVVETTDFDGDGDQDILVADRHVKVLIDRQTQLHAPLPARLGRQYRLDVWAARSGWNARDRDIGILPFIGPGRVRIPVPGVGTLGVDPASAIPLPAAFLPWRLPEPRSISSVVIPNVPTLRGVTLWSQALLVWDGGLALTGLERDVVR